jgi:two-component system, LytTR family, response regulator
MKIRCVIVDDEDLALDLLRHFVNKETSLELIGEFTSPEKAIHFILSEKPDLIFTDIQMPQFTGIDLIRKIDYKPVFILVTAYTEYAQQAFDLDVVDYLLKPYSQARFKKTLEKARLYLTERLSAEHDHLKKDVVSIKHNGFWKEIPVSEILFIEGMKQYIKIQTTTTKYIHLESLNRFHEKLPTYFLRVHKSFIINKTRIEKFQKGNLFLANFTVPVSRGFKF